MRNGLEWGMGYTQYKRSALAMLKLESGCVDCGYDKSPAALSFDHVRGEKAFNPSDSNLTLDEALDEIEKCEVRCENCHRERTWGGRVRTFTIRVKAELVD